VRKKAILAACQSVITLPIEKGEVVLRVNRLSEGRGGTFDFDYYIKKHIPMVTGFTNINPIIQVDEVVAGI
jgi:hypothetical protein